MNKKEREIIKKIVARHKDLFKVTDMDVAESVKGEWFFMRYNREDEYYDTLIRVETARELAECMVGEMAMDIFSIIDSTPDMLEKFHNFANDLEMETYYRTHIDRLLEYIEK